MRPPRRRDHPQRDLSGGAASGAGLAGQPLAQGMVGVQHRRGRVDPLQIIEFQTSRLDEVEALGRDISDKLDDGPPSPPTGTGRTTT
jgi:hypothetical protein